MNQILELHDSEVAMVRFDGGTAVIVFSHAYVHRSEGKPGEDPGTGWSQRAELVIEGVSETKLPHAWPCRIYDGSLELAQIVHNNVIPIPLVHDGRTKLRLDVADGDDNFTSLEITGNRVCLTLLGEASYIEEFPGTD